LTTARVLSPRPSSRATFVLKIIAFAERHPIAYLAGCALLGLTIRYLMAGGDIGRFVDPLYPLIHH
jgi:hypothetical protein